MKIIIKAICVILISTLLTFNMPLYSNADFSFEDIFNAVQDFEDVGDNDEVVNKEGDMQKLSNSVSNILLTIALGVTMISAVVMGINFAIQSVEDKAKIKESMVPWIIGIAVSFGAYGIWRITMNLFYGF